MSGQHASSNSHPVINFVHGSEKAATSFDNRFGQIDLARTAAQMVAANRAFRQVGPLATEPVLNTAGNLRGMVLSAKWNTTFRYVSGVGKYMENIGLLAGVAAGLAESAPRIEAILKSSESPTSKGMQLSVIASTISQRAILGVIPTGTHLIYRSLEGWCMLGALFGGEAAVLANKGIQTLQSSDTLVQTTFKTVTDAENQGKFAVYAKDKAVSYVIDVIASARK